MPIKPTEGPTLTQWVFAALIPIMFLFGFWIRGKADAGTPEGSSPAVFAWQCDNATMRFDSITVQQWDQTLQVRGIHVLACEVTSP